MAQKKTTKEVAKTNTAEFPEPKVEKVIEELSCQLSPVEWNSRADELATAHKAVQDVEARKKSMMKQIGYDLAQAKIKVDKLTDVVASHSEIREVTVKIIFDYEKGTVKRIRTDTDEVISERDMIDAERQTELVSANTFIEDAGRGDDVPEGEVVDPVDVAAENLGDSEDDDFDSLGDEPTEDVKA